MGTCYFFDNELGASVGCDEARSLPPGRLNNRVIEMADPDVNFLVRQNERILIEVGSLRDDMAVLTAMVMRPDGSHAALLQETRATHARIARMNDCIRKLEAEGEGA